MKKKAKAKKVAKAGKAATGAKGAKGAPPPWDWSDKNFPAKKDRFFGTQIWTLRQEAIDDGVEVTGTLFFTFPRDRNYEQHWQYLIPKIGIQIAPGERAELGWLRSPERKGAAARAIRPAAEFVSELDRFFGPAAGARWVGFVPDESALVQPSFPQPYTAAWTVRLRLTPRPTATRLLPLVFKHYRVPFSDRHLTGVWEIPGR
jgi:hypothetical protein